MAFAFIFFVARGCVATQESTQVRKYVTNADSLLSESSNLGNESLQGTLQRAGGDPAKLDVEALNQVTNRSQSLYLQALNYDEVEVPPEFENAHHYLVSSLGLRAQTTERLAKAATGDAEGFTGTLAEAVEFVESVPHAIEEMRADAPGRRVLEERPMTPECGK